MCSTASDSHAFAAYAHSRASSTSSGRPVFAYTLSDEFLAAVSGAATLYVGLRSPRNGSTSSASFDNFEVRQAIIA